MTNINRTLAALLLAISATACSASPASEMVAAGQRLVAAMQYCISINLKSDEDCNKKTVRLKQEWNAARAKVTTDSPATRAIEEQVRATELAVMAAVFSNIGKR